MKFRLKKAFDTPLGRFEEQDVFAASFGSNYYDFYVVNTDKSEDLNVGSLSSSGVMKGAITNSEWFEKIEE